MSRIPEKILQAGVSAYAEKFLYGKSSFGEGIEAAYFAIHDHEDWIRPGLAPWDGEGPPPVGTVCEVLWNESRLEYLKTKIFGINEHGQPIHRFEEGPKKYEYQADVLRTDSGTQVFMPLKTPEQIAADEREQEVKDLYYTINWGESPEHWSHVGDVRKADYAKAIDAGYRKQEAS
ncbi:hypothetical protein QU926_20640 [Pseudomonas asiatica]|uniref:hypothetical protein n=1 Tax=Pseudomonas asiatica TaxID=2219225 RepID=UPI0025AA5CDF|nr:hypothetical protein [Pseudomonas asiatica]MDM9556024.1 hypothetical protein [Pseudomonas asiatica]